jgi:UDP-N-acetylglucosamine 2-epimerase
VGNSSVGIRESSFLGIPVVNIGLRQHGRERGFNILDVGYSRTEITNAITSQIDNGRYGCSEIYGNGKAGLNIAKVLAEAPLTIEKRLSY